MNEKILNIIKKKVDEATPEELDEALKYIEKKLKSLGVCMKGEMCICGHLHESSSSGDGLRTYCTEGSQCNKCKGFVRCVEDVA